jgi:hypothetical protein
MGGRGRAIPTGPSLQAWASQRLFPKSVFRRMCPTLCPPHCQTPNKSGDLGKPDRCGRGLGGYPAPISGEPLVGFLRMSGSGWLPRAWNQFLQVCRSVPGYAVRLFCLNRLFFLYISIFVFSLDFLFKKQRQLDDVEKGKSAEQNVCDVYVIAGFWESLRVRLIYVV